MRPPILFVHGAFGQAANFEPWLGYFREAGHSCSAISLPGRAPQDLDVLRRLTLADYVAAVRQAITKHAEPPVVVGHSMGGLIAMMAAMEMECAGLVLVAAPAPGRLPAQLSGFRFALPFLHRILTGLPVRPSPEAVRTLVTHDLSAAESDEIIAQTTMESGRVLRRLTFCATKVAFEKFRCPVLCLGAGADRVVPHSAVDRIASATGGERVVFPGHGHWLIADSLTGLVAATVKDWLHRTFERE